MGTTEQRIAFLEGQVMQQTNTLDAVRTDLRTVEDRIERKLDAIDGKLSRMFMWLVGLMAGTIAASLATMMAAVLSK